MKIIKTRQHIGFVSFLMLMTLFMIGAPSAIAAEKTAVNKHITSELFLDISSIGRRLVAVGQRGHIVYSDDDGQQWWHAKVPTQRLLTAVSFSPDGTGWAVGHDAIILKSEDNGETWTGMHGALTTENLAEDPLFDVHFINNNIGYAVGGFGLALKTTDAGKSWQAMTEQLPNEDGMHLNQIASDGQGNVYIAGEAGLFLHSADFGKKWRAVELPYLGTLNGVISLADGSVVTYGLRGNIFVSNAQAKNWQRLTGNQQNTLFGATLSATGELIVVGDGGIILAKRDEQWQTAILQNKAPISSVIAVNNDLLIVVGMAGIQRVFGQTQQRSKLARHNNEY